MKLKQHEQATLKYPSRRAFILSFVALLVPHQTMTLVRPSVDVDLTAMSLIHALGCVGTGPYTITVAPENIGYARVALCRAFGPDDRRYADFTIVTSRFESIDSWTLDNGSIVFYTVGT